MITLKNEFITAKISEKGAELKGLVCGGNEYIWPGDEKIWAMSAPHLFPICGGLKDDEYYLDGKKYNLSKHGYIRFELFSVEEKSEESVTFLHTSSEERKKHFPFDYELRITFTATAKRLSVRYDVKNCSADTMYFSIGGHTGYYCPEGIEQYDIILPFAETLDSTVPCGNVLLDKKVRVLEGSDTLALDYKYFEDDALVFADIKARSVVLRNRVTGKALRLDFDGSDCFLFWTKVGAPYICLEPWSGCPDLEDTDQNFKTKKGIISLAAGSTYTLEHVNEIL